jgi:phospholipid-binding lipoprotein MlaA
MLAMHMIAASLAAAEPATAPPPPIPPVAQAPAAAPTTSEPPSPADIPPAENPPEVSPAAPPAQAEQASAASKTQSAPADDFELDLGQAGLEKDPLEGFNRLSYEISQALDKVIIRPAAMVYRHFPKPARDGVHNVLSNLGEPVVFLNDMLQLRLDRAVRTLGRFVINSALGLGGLLDIAKRKPFHLPHHANSLGDTLGYYGVGPGPYIYVPILGPTTLRDVTGSAEQLFAPLIIGAPLDDQNYQIATLIAGGLDQRERADEDLKAMLRDAIDPYATMRANFLQNRAGEISGLKARQLDPETVSTPADPLAHPLTNPTVPASTPTSKGQ